MNTIDVDIIGTCFSRELFNETDKYKVRTYLMQQSIFTMFSNPLPIKENEIKTYDNYNFKKRMINYEFNKLALKKLFEKPSEYLILDLLNEARDFYDFSNPSNVRIIVTKENTLTLENLNDYKDYRYSIIEVKKLSEQDIINHLKKFLNEIVRYYDKNKIILNRTQLQNEYFCNNKKYIISDNFIYNRQNFVKKLEELFLKLLPTCKTLYTKYEPILDVNHRLGGPHPGHFEKIYCDYRMKKLDNIINREYSDTVLDEQFLTILKQQEERIKSKKLTL